MHNDDLHTDEPKHETKAPRTIEEFSADAIAFVTRHGSNADVFTRHMTDWKSGGYDPTVLGQNIRGILEFQRSQLAKRQFRSDGSKERLIQIITDIEEHVTENYVDHLKQVIIGTELIEWCDTYTARVAAPQTT
jgi:hypothetical protein